MRRVLLGGLGIALGVFARPAAAQDVFPGRPADPVTRAARLGRPVATPTAPAASGVVPAGLTARGQVTPGVPGTSPVPMVMPPTGGMGTPTPVPPPRPVGGAPGVTLLRDMGPGPAGGVPYAGPVVLPGVTVVPPVGPVDCGVDCPVPCPDEPFGGAPTSLAPRFPALTRLLGCGGDRRWVSAEYLGWWTRSTQVPVLAATGPIPAPGGVVSTPTPILAGSFGETLHGGVRIAGGWWFSDEQRRGVDARLFYLFRNGTEFTANSAQFPVLGRPFFNVNAPVGPLTDVIGAPGLAGGGLAVNLQNSLWGAEVNYRRFLAGTPCARLDGIVGYRYLNFTEELSITETGTLLDPTMLAAGRAPFASATDRFRTENNFHGGQVGLVGELRRGRWFVDGRASIAFGNVHQSAEISGGQLQGFGTAPPAQFAGGLLALPGANTGTFSQNKFAVLPEAGVNFGYHITPHLRMFVGYNFLYLSSVLRPANVIDTNVDASRVPNFLSSPAPILAGPARPSPMLNTTDFWAQGISIGMQWTY